MKLKVVGGPAEPLVKRMVYLAWQRSRCHGAGFLQDRGDQPEDAVWQSAVERRDYAGLGSGPGKAHCDYVFGRMMKLYLSWDGDTVTCNNALNWRDDYQSFCHAYPDAASLAQAAVESLSLPGYMVLRVVEPEPAAG